MLRITGGTRARGGRDRRPRLARGIIGSAVAGTVAAAVVVIATPPAGSAGPAGPATSPGAPAEAVPVTGPTATTAPDGPATTMFGTPPPPGAYVGVGEDGVLATVSASTGERIAELARGRPPGQGGRAIAGVTVSPDGATAWYDTRRPGAPGRIYQVPTDGSAPAVQVATGTFPEVDPAGQRLAFVGQGAVVVHGIDTDEEERWPVSGQVSDLTWATDGSGMYWIRDRTELVWLDRAGGAEPRVVATADPGERFHLPLGGAATVNVVATTGPKDPAPQRVVISNDGGVQDRFPDSLGVALDRSYEATGSWGLRTTVSRTVRWSGSGGIGTIGHGYVAADW